MDKPYLNHVRTLHSHFENNFMEAYRELSKSTRRKILPHLHSLYRRWYYSTFVEGTPFSPANFMLSICEYFEIAEEVYPNPKLRTPSKVMGVDMLLTEYTVDKHPVVLDIAEVIGFSEPIIDIHKDDCLTTEQASALATKLSLKDTNYAAFLFEIAMRLGLLEKVPALYVNRHQVSEKWDDVSKLPSRELLKLVVSAAIDYASYGIHKSCPLPSPVLSPSFFKGLMANPLPVEEIVFVAFKQNGINMNEILSNNMLDKDLDEMDADDETANLVHSSYMLGLAIDRYFLTPLGYFLRVVCPMYSFPLMFDEEVFGFMEVGEDPLANFFAFCAPAVNFKLTKLGLELFEIAPTPLNSFIPNSIPFEPLKDSVFQSEEALESFIDMAGQLLPAMLESIMRGQVYTFRVRLVSKPSKWVHIQIFESSSLHDFFLEISQMFELKPTSEYSFFHDKTENFFAEYPSEKRASRSKKPRKNTETLLAEVDFMHMKHMILAVFNQSVPFTQELPVVRFEIEFLNVREPDFDEDYPRISRMSKAMSGGKEA